jgi:DNA polymerase bacteriophage-type
MDVVLDFETASAADLKRVGADVYCAHPTTEVLCMTYKVGKFDAPRLWTPGDTDPLLTALVNDPTVLLIAHNARFERAVWQHHMVPLYGFSPLPAERWHDTMAVCAMKGLPLALDEVARFLNLRCLKDMSGSNVTVGMSRLNKRGFYDRSPATRLAAGRYCIRDVEAQAELHQRLGPLPPSEREIWLIDQQINDAGLYIDLEFVDSALSVVEQHSRPLFQEFKALTGGITPTQVAKYQQWLRAHGFYLPNLTKEAVAAVIGAIDPEDEDDSSAGEDPPPDRVADGNVRRTLEIRQLLGSASIKKLARMKECAGADGRVRGTFQYHAAGTGRWGGRLFQPQNFPRQGIQITDASGNRVTPKPEDCVAAITSRDTGGIEAAIGDPIRVVIQSLRHAIMAQPEPAGPMQVVLTCHDEIVCEVAE